MTPVTSLCEPREGRATLALRGVRARHGLTSPLTLSLKAPQLVGVVGANGAGKSTLLRLILGLSRAEGGEVLLGGRSASELNELERPRWLSYLPQSPPYSPHWRLFELSLMGAPLTLPLSERRARARRSLERVGLWERAEARLGTLSGGELRRGFIARVLSQGAHVSLLDEPLAHLDWAQAEAQLKLIKQQQLSAGQLTLIALHDLNLASLYCDALLLMKAGEPSVFGDPAEVLTSAHLSSAFGEEPLLIQHPHATRAQLLPRGEGSPNSEAGLNIKAGLNSEAGLNIKAGLNSEASAQS